MESTPEKYSVSSLLLVEQGRVQVGCNSTQQMSGSVTLLVLHNSAGAEETLELQW